MIIAGESIEEDTTDNTDEETAVEAAAEEATEETVETAADGSEETGVAPPAVELAAPEAVETPEAKPVSILHLYFFKALLFKKGFLIVVVTRHDAVTTRIFRFIKAMVCLLY